MNNQLKIKSLLLSISSLIVFVLVFILLSQIKHLIPEKFERYTHGILGTIASLATVWLFLKYEKSTFKEYGLEWKKSTMKKFAIGLAIGAVICMIMLFTQVLYSGLEVRISDKQNITSFLIWSPAIIILAFMEEVAFRSYAFIKLDRVFGFRTTQIIIAILFALYHVLNGWTIGQSFIGPGILALVFGLSAKVSAGISMPTGLHSGVNLILALFVGKKNIESIWTIDFPTEVSESVLKANENFGIGIQLCLLILCVIATELYLKRIKTTANRVE